MIINEIIEQIERLAPLHYQEEWDNSGLQVGNKSIECTGVLICVDCTPTVIDEAIMRGCNLIVSHHPLIFKGLKHITGTTPAEEVIIKAINSGVAIYSSHTALDNAPGGVSYCMAQMLKLKDVEVLAPRFPDKSHNEDEMRKIGLGCVGSLPKPQTARDIALFAKTTFGCENVRISSSAINPSYSKEMLHLTRVALCGGAGGSMINDAIRSGAQIYITADLRYHDFVDYSAKITLVDIGHFDSEACGRNIFYQQITEKFPNFAVHIASSEKNPIQYL